MYVRNAIKIANEKSWDTQSCMTGDVKKIIQGGKLMHYLGNKNGVVVNVDENNIWLKVQTVEKAIL